MLEPKHSWDELKKLPLCFDDTSVPFTIQRGEHIYIEKTYVLCACVCVCVCSELKVYVEMGPAFTNPTPTQTAILQEMKPLLGANFCNDFVLLLMLLIDAIKNQEPILLLKLKSAMRHVDFTCCGFSLKPLH